MKILITGSNGFIGKHLSNELAKSGHCPIPLKSNLLDQKSLAQELRESEFDQVVHLAGLSHQLNHKAEDFYFNNVIGSQNLISGIEQFFKNFGLPSLVVCCDITKTFFAPTTKSIAPPTAGIPFPVVQFARSPPSETSIAPNTQ